MLQSKRRVSVLCVGSFCGMFKASSASKHQFFCIAVVWVLQVFNFFRFVLGSPLSGQHFLWQVGYASWTCKLGSHSAEAGKTLHSTRKHGKKFFRVKGRGVKTTGRKQSMVGSVVLEKDVKWTQRVASADIFEEEYGSLHTTLPQLAQHSKSNHQRSVCNTQTKKKL